MFAKNSPNRMVIPFESKLKTEYKNENEKYSAFEYVKFGTKKNNKDKKKD